MSRRAGSNLTRYAYFASIVGMCLLAIPRAHAEIVQFQVQGTVTAVTDPNGVVPLPVALGDHFSLFYSYETNTPGTLPNTGPSNTLIYAGLTSVILDVGGNRFTIAPPVAPIGEIILTNDLCQSPFDPCEDHYFVHTYLTGETAGSSPQLLMEMSLAAFSPTGPVALASTALLASAPNVGAFTARGTSFTFFDQAADWSGNFDGTIDSIAPIPLPAPAILFLSALAGLWAPGRRRAGSSART